MKLGTLSINNNLLLAPMQGVTTAPYRRFCRSFQKVGLVYVPMIYTKKIEKNPDSINSELYKIEEERPISVQLIGSDPIALRKSIIFLENFKFDILDINAGCPSKRAIRAQEGGYLLKNLSLLNQIINVALKFSSKPISLKMRIGFEDKINLDELIRFVNNSCINFLIIHGRTVKDRYNEDRIDLEIIKKIKEKVCIPVIGNGDIGNPQSAKKFLNYTNVDALMIGRGSIGNPEIFSQINDFLKKDKYTPFKNDISKMKKYIEIFEKHLDKFMDINFKMYYSKEDYRFIEIKRNSIWLTKNIKNSTLIRKMLSNATNLKDLKEKLQKVYEHNFINRLL